MWTKSFPLGSGQPPKLYNAVADALLWILENSDGVEGLHYLTIFCSFVFPIQGSVSRHCT